MKKTKECVCSKDEVQQETTNHYFVCEITGIPKKILPLVAWRLRNQQDKIQYILRKAAHGEL